MKSLYNLPLYRLFFLLGKRRRRQLYFLIFLLFLNGFLESFSIASIIPFFALASPGNEVYELQIIKFFTDIFDISDKSQLIPFITVIFCVFIFLSISLRIFNIAYISRLSAKVNIDISYLILKNNMYQSYYRYTQRNSSEIISLALEKVYSAASALSSLLTVLASSIIALFIIISLLIFNWKILLIGGFSLSIYYCLVYNNVKGYLIKKGNIISLIIPERLRVIQEAFEGFRDVIINGNQKIYINLFNNLDAKIKLNNANSEFLIASPRFLIEGITFLVIAISGYVFLSAETKPSFFIPMAGSFIFAFQRLMPLIQQIYAAWANYKYKYAVINDLVEELEKGTNNEKLFFSKKEIKFEKNFKLENISFNYANSKNVLEDVNLKINKGDIIGIYGETGSGKTTLLDLIMGLLVPKNGKIYINEVDVLSKYSTYNWSVNIAHVPQNIFLKEGTIAENIAFGESFDEIDFDILIKSSKIAHIFDFINKSDRGFRTIVGERGIRLSGGQRQRIAIARAIYKSRSILVLDEATSALDETTEEKILNSILNMNKKLTIIMVTHRIHTLKNCDRIFKVANNNVFEVKEVI